MKKELMLSKFGIFFVMAGVVAFLLISGADAALARDYTGVKKCKICHKSAKRGEQYPKWEASKHAKAYEVLGTPEAKEVADKLGIADPQTSGKCLKCHSTAYGLTTEQVSETIPVEEGVSCESCHGAGKDYMKSSVMKNRDMATAAGLVIPDETTCLKCHNEESPNYQPFDYAARNEEIKHPVPGT